MQDGRCATGVEPFLARKTGAPKWMNGGAAVRLHRTKSPIRGWQAHLPHLNPFVEQPAQVKGSRKPNTLRLYTVHYSTILDLSLASGRYYQPRALTTT